MVRPKVNVLFVNQYERKKEQSEIAIWFMIRQSQREKQPNELNEKWARKDSNLQPSGYEPPAPPLSYRPCMRYFTRGKQIGETNIYKTQDKSYCILERFNGS